MKFAARFLAIIALLALLATGYLYKTAGLTVGDTSYLVESAADRIDAFDSIVGEWRNGGESITGYVKDVGEADQYSFVSYTVTLKNGGFFDDEWIILTPEVKEGDVMYISSTIEDIPKRSAQTISFVMMVDRNCRDYARQATLGYFVNGHYREATLNF